MPNGNPGLEILGLLDKQVDLLDLSLFMALTNEEKGEYEARKRRIRELNERLG